MNDENTQESEDQPQNEESETDQPEDVESSEEEESLEDEDQPQEGEDEESSEEQFVEIDGKQYTMDEIKQGFMRQDDYTKKTQALAEQRKLHEDTVKPEKELSPEEKQVQAFIEQYGLMTQGEFEKKMQLIKAQQLDMDDFQNWKSSMNPDPNIAEAVYKLGKAYPKMSYTDIYKKFYGDIATPKKVVKRRVVGLKGRSGEKKTGTGGLTREKIAKMSTEEYLKNKDKIHAAMSKGEIK